MRSTCHVQSFIFFPLGAVSETGPVFSIFPTWLPHHVTYDVIIIIITFYMIVAPAVKIPSIRQAVAEKNTKVLCGQTNKTTTASLCRGTALSLKYFSKYFRLLLEALWNILGNNPYPTCTIYENIPRSTLLSWGSAHARQPFWGRLRHYKKFRIGCVPKSNEDRKGCWQKWSEYFD